MTSDSTVVPLRQPEVTEDPLTAVLRNGARRLLAQAIEAEAEAFLAAMRDKRLPDGRERVVRHGLGPERTVQTGIGTTGFRCRRLGPVAVRRVFLNAGPLASSVDEFGAFLAARGHTRLVVGDYVRSARHFGQWLALEGIAPQEVSDGVVVRFAAHCCRCPGGRRRRGVSKCYAARVGCFVEFLRARGQLPAAPRAQAVEMPRRLAAFRDHLLQERGLVPPTAARHVRLVAALLPGLGDDLATYGAAALRQVALDAAAGSSPAEAKTTVTALRVYLRFLAARGECRPGLDHAIPTVPQWRLSALPRYLPPGDVERVIAACDARTPRGLRDRAILLLLARLGLRAGDVFGLRLDDIDWGQAALRLRGKGRRDVHLPLPQDVGDALLA